MRHFLSLVPCEETVGGEQERASEMTHSCWRIRVALPLTMASSPCISNVQTSLVGLRLQLMILACSSVILGKRHLEEKAPSSRTFTIVNDTFVKDGVPFTYISGTMHYWRVPYQRWSDTFYKMRMAGLTAVDTYLVWNLHEQEPGIYDFHDNLEFTRFFELAQQQGLYVILRPGPFIAAEVDGGGLPYWLVREDPTTRLRSNNPAFLKFVSRWFDYALPLVVPYLYKNGGPIITVQVENEYGAFGCDQSYMVAIRDLLVSYLGDDIVYFTNNYPEDSYPICGQCPGTLTTGDFGTNTISGKNVSYYLDNLRHRYNVTGPLVDTEFYDGWLETWGDPYPVVPTSEILDSMRIFFERKASFNLYVFHGGSNFGFEAVYGVTTTYDFNAALNEAGDPTEKYYAIRNFIGKYFPLPPGPAPTPSPKAAYGRIQMLFAGTIYQNLAQLCPDGSVNEPYPLTFEDLKQAHGFVLYRTVIEDRYKDPTVLSVPGLADRGIVLLNKKPVGILDRANQVFNLDLHVKPGQVLDILVLNEGRSGWTLTGDFKGIVGNVSLNHQVLHNWSMFKLDLPHYPIASEAGQPFEFPIRDLKGSYQTRTPSFYSGRFFVASPARDTFLKLDGWNTGYAFINGNNIGRYWPNQGPQVTLYIPSVFLRENHENTVELFEIEESPCLYLLECTVELIDYPILNATVPNSVVEKKGIAQQSRFRKAH